MSYKEINNLKGLKEIRKFLGISQNALGRFTGLTQNTISSLETNTCKPSLINAQKIIYAINHLAYFKQKSEHGEFVLFEFKHIFPNLNFDEIDDNIFHLTYMYAIDKYGIEGVL